MDWSNDHLIKLIQGRSRNLDFLQTRKPTPPNTNPLIENNERIRSVKLRLKLNEIRTKDDSSLVSTIADSIELGSEVRPLPKDHDYLDGDIEDFLFYHSEVDEWRKENKDIEQIVLGRDSFDLQPFSMVFETNIEKPILMFSGGGNCRTIGLYEYDNILGEHMRPYSTRFNKLSEIEIDKALEDVNFSSLRRRLINAGYDNFVSEIDKELEMYF